MPLRILSRWLLELTSLAALATLPTFTAAGCLEGDRACYPRDWRACECAGDRPGYQQCQGDGSAYGACDCSGTIPGLTTSVGSGGGGEGGGGDKLPFLSECSTSDQCETGLCYPFNAKGPHCTQPCGGASDCPPPSPGCNNMGVCKVP